MTIKTGHSSSDDNGVYADIPIITDVVVVEIDDAEHGVVLPTATNPNYVGGANNGAVAVAPAAASPTATRQQTSPTDSVAAAAASTSATTTDAVVTTNTYQIPHTVLQNPTTYTTLGRGSTGLQCPYCGRQTVTTVRDVIGVGTVVATVILACLFWPLCWLPFVVPSCKRTHHYCGHDACRKKVGETRVCA